MYKNINDLYDDYDLIIEQDGNIILRNKITKNLIDLKFKSIHRLLCNFLFKNNIYKEDNDIKEIYKYIQEKQINDLLIKINNIKAP